MTPVGILPVDKPSGPTSHDIVALARRALGVRRVGHTGTLDPFASGLLLLCVGWATRLAEYLSPLTKAYTAVVRLGERTDTDDRTGGVIARSDAWRSLRRSDIEDALAAQVGHIEQRPPDYSAKKVGGRRAYAVARSGARPALTAEAVEVTRLEILELAPPDVTLAVECGAGTYVRAIARDLGEDLHTGAHLRELRRTRIGRFAVEDAVAVGQPPPSREMWLDGLQPPAVGVSHLPELALDDAAAEALRQGREIEALPAGGEDGVLAVLHRGALVGIAVRQAGRIRPRKIFRAAT